MQSSPKAVDVSRETFERLNALHELVLKWNKTINLISKSSIPELWDRHIWDSAQIAGLHKSGKKWVDIGSGGGFPGLVVAIMSLETAPDREMMMIESDVRKAAFLRTVIRELGLNAKVLVERIENAAPQVADVLSARALAELPVLMAFAERHSAPGCAALFMKGTTWEKELRKASELWSFEVKTHKSRTDPAAVILELKDIERV